MIQEDYVSFEVAKLLKEKGFDGDCGDCECHMFYHEMTNRIMPIMEIGIIPDYDTAYFAPTLQMAMKWLREVYGLFITIYPNYGTEKIAWSVHQRDYDMNWVTIKHNYADYYEEACEAALRYTLENLI